MDKKRKWCFTVFIDMKLVKCLLFNQICLKVFGLLSLAVTLVRIMDHSLCFVAIFFLQNLIPACSILLHTYS